MRSTAIRRITMTLLALFMVVIIAGSTAGLDNRINVGNTLRLQSPPFLTSARAEANNEIADSLDTEAGISAYYQTVDPINLDNAASAYRVIELRTADYIIGSVPVPAYEEHYDAHVYVHKDGWILAYYNKDNPIAKLVDIEHNTVSTTNLHTAVSIVASAAGVSFGSVNYYDFRYPNATHILMVAENEYNGLDFTINLPSSYGYYERGFAIGSSNSGFFTLDGVDLPYTYYIHSPFYHAYGVISASQLLPDITHTVEMYINGHYCVLIIIYREG